MVLSTIPTMLSTVISSSAALYGEHRDFGTPHAPYPRMKVRSRPSRCHSLCMKTPLDTRISPISLRHVSRSTRRCHYDTMAVNRHRLHHPPWLGGKGDPRPPSRMNPQSALKKIHSAHLGGKQGKGTGSCCSSDSNSRLRKGLRKGNGKITHKKRSSAKTDVNVRWLAGRPYSRYFTKEGMCLKTSYYSKTKSNFVNELISTIVNLKYSWILFVFTLSYIVTWTAFAELYFIDTWLRGDVAELQDPQWQPCFEKVDSFQSALSLSGSIINGYRSRVLKKNCIDSILLMMAQTIIESVLDAFMVGCVLAKMSKPKSKLPSLLFSQHCVVSERDERLCLMFNVQTLNETHMLEAEIRAKLMKSCRTKEGELIPLEQREIDLGPNCAAARLFTEEPQTMEHVIDERSPLWGISANPLRGQSYEIVIIVEGSVHESGPAFQVRTSYTEDEIIWGQRYKSYKVLDERMSSQRKADKTYKVKQGLHNSDDSTVRHRPEGSAVPDTDSAPVTNPLTISTKEIHQDVVLFCSEATSKRCARKVGNNEFFI